MFGQKAQPASASSTASTPCPGRCRCHCVGVLWHKPSRCDLLFITLRSEALFSPTTRYRDLALGPSLFHWESQSTTTVASATGQRYIHHGDSGLELGAVGAALTPWWEPRSGAVPRLRS